MPPYIKYKFHDSPEYVSNKKEHVKDLDFNERNVILLGTMSTELLREFLLGPPLKIEIHDRDPKECLKKKAGIFGSQPNDEEISNVTFTTSMINIFNVCFILIIFDIFMSIFCCLIGKGLHFPLFVSLYWKNYISKIFTIQIFQSRAITIYWV